MHIKYYLIILFLGISVQAQAQSFDIGKFKNNYFLSCSKEMSSGADAFPEDLSMSICSCSAASIVSAFSAKQLQSIEKDIAANYQLLSPYVKSCTNLKFPKYIENNPDFLQQYIKRHPELLE